MARGNEIIVSADPKGTFLEGIIDGTPKPGTVMQVKAGVEMVGGRFTWEAFNQAGDGVASLIAVLLPDQLIGKLATDAYVSGTRGFLYCPIAGEEMNMLIGDVAGTSGSSDFAIGDRLMVDDGTGKLVDDSSGASVPFICLETITDLAADYLALCMYTGH